jgi:hypothetical protein
VSIACEAALSAAEYDVVPTLATLAADRRNSVGDLAATSLIELAETLSAQAGGLRNYRDRRDPQLIRGRLNGALETALVQSPPPLRTEVVEAYLLMCDRDTPGLRRILQDRQASLHLPVTDALLSSPRPGILKLLVELLDDPHPPSPVFRIVSQRRDRSFVTELFTRMSATLSPTRKKNLNRIGEMPWVHDDLSWLESLDPSAQQGAVHVAVASGVPRDDAFRVVTQMARQGTVPGRVAAIAALAEFSGTEANRLILMALSDVEPQVQVAALAQLRDRRMPSALPHIIELLDSPHAGVRQQARECLPEFTLGRYLAAFALLDEEVARSTGRIVRHVDGDALDQLAKEFTAGRRERRRRAPAVTVAMDLVGELEDDLVLRLADEDHLVRREAAQALARSTSAEARDGLHQALLDPHPLVRLAAETSIQLLGTARGPEATGTRTENAPAVTG